LKQIKEINYANLNTFFYSKANEKQKEKAIDYLIYDIAHPDKKTEFKKEIGFKKYILRTPYLGNILIPLFSKHLLKKGYDALLLSYGEEIIGRTAFQTKIDFGFRRPSIHVFGIQITSEYRGNHLSTYMQEQLLKCKREENYKLIRFGKGGDKTVNKIVEDFANRSKSLNIEYLGHNYFKIN